MNELMTSREVAFRMGISVSAVGRLAGRGTLAAVWFGKQRLFRRSAVEALLRDEGFRQRSRARGRERVQVREQGVISL